VFLNVHSADGAPLISDLLLDGLPLLRDDRSLYVMREGGAGGADGIAGSELQRIEILDASGALHPALLSQDR
jgi:hypothetical protein